MDKNFIQFFDELKSILTRFFELKYTRFSIPQKETKDTEEVYQLACQMYKRGFISVINQNKITNTHNINFLSMSNFIIALMSQKKEDVFLIIDKNFLNLQKEFKESVKNFNYYVLESHENIKNLETALKLLHTIYPVAQSVYAIGGGVVLDIVGFVCKLLNKEVVYVPTTILGAVDACIGGKTGVNFMPYGKNQIGFFSQPREITIVADFFSTLPFHEKISGLGEAFKHSWIFGEFLNDFYLFQKIYTKISTSDDYINLIKKNIKYKSEVISCDPLELTSLRSILNFGHTFAHLLESICIKSKDHSIPHGIAVLHGIRFLLIANLINWPNFIENYKYLINSICKDFPIYLNKKITIHDIEFYLNQDKKNLQSNQITLILPEYGILAGKKQKSQVNGCIKKYSTHVIAFHMLEYINSFQ